MTDLSKIIDDTEFDGLIVVGDVHADCWAVSRAIEYARLNRLFIVFLGDLTDGGTDPYGTVALVHRTVFLGKGAFVVGNHDHKYIRYAAGRKVILREMHHVTFAQCGDNRDSLLSLLKGLGDHPLTGFTHTFGRFVFAHGAVHRTVYADPTVVTTKIRERALYGEITGERDKDDFPVRHYSWVDDIPAGYSTITGHDRRPMGGELLEDTGPMVVRNSVGGKAFFIDTGCGKTANGYLSGSVLALEGNDLSFDRFVKF